MIDDRYLKQKRSQQLHKKRRKSFALLHAAHRQSFLLLQNIDLAKHLGQAGIHVQTYRVVLRLQHAQLYRATAP